MKDNLPSLAPLLIQNCLFLLKTRQSFSAFLEEEIDLDLHVLVLDFCCRFIFRHIIATLREY